MKKTLIRTLMLLTTLMVLSCKEENPDDIILNYKDQELKGISEKTAMDMANGYRELHLPVINRNLDLDDTRSMWYDLESFKNLIWQMEIAAKKVYKDGDKPALGIRVYYGTFPQNIEEYDDLAGLGPEYARTHGLMFVPTFDDEGINKNFNPIQNQKDFDADPNKKAFEPAKMVFKLPSSNIIQSDTLQRSNLRMNEARESSQYYYILDHGIKCPEACPGGE
ncbi:MAG: hypothetical protein IPN72_17955 [Saprospiraceae bacterium]|nr:hypothetical protein [Saprospiraceae bacterium]